MKFRIEITEYFEKEVKPLLKKYPSLKSDIDGLITQLESNPQLGISLGHNLFKIRISISSKGKGKSGGGRVITFIVKENEVVYLMSIYDKSEYDTAKPKALLEILRREGLL